MDQFNYIKVIIRFIIDLILYSIRAIMPLNPPPAIESEQKNEDFESNPQDGVETNEQVEDINISYPPKEKKLNNKYFWILDPGHGANTSGKRSPDGQLMEYAFNRDIADRISEKLTSLKIAHALTVKDDRDMSLKDRVRLANEYPSALPKRFISIHGNGYDNAGSWSTPNGIETWHFNNSHVSREMAMIFQRHIVAALRWKDRGVRSKKEKQFYVLKHTNMPAILTENGFFTNKEQKEEMIKPEVRESIAYAHVLAILEYEETIYTHEHIPVNKI